MLFSSTNVNWQVYATTAAGLGIICLFPSGGGDSTGDAGRGDCGSVNPVYALDKAVVTFRREGPSSTASAYTISQKKSNVFWEDTDERVEQQQ